MSVSFIFLQMPLSKTTDQQYTCLDCGKEFAQRVSLSHIGSVHSMKKKHSCMVCGWYHTHTTNLSWHMMSHHHQTVQSEVLEHTFLAEYLVVEPDETLFSTPIPVFYHNTRLRTVIISTTNRTLIYFLVFRPYPVGYLVDLTQASRLSLSAWSG